MAQSEQGFWTPENKFLGTMASGVMFLAFMYYFDLKNPAWWHYLLDATIGRVLYYAYLYSEPLGIILLFVVFFLTFGAIFLIAEQLYKLLRSLIGRFT